MKTLRDKVIIVTGAGGAVAGSVESAFRKQGARLVLVDRDALHIEERAVNYHVAPVTADFSTSARAQAVVAQVEAELGRVDGLVHLIGEVVTGSLVGASEADFDRAFSTNVKTLFNAVQAVLPVLLKREEGFIGGVASQAAWGGGAADAGLFAAAKSAVATLLRSLDADLVDTQIEVAVVCPMGPVDTSANRARLRDVDPAHLISPFALAQALVAAALSRGGRLLDIPVYPPRARR